MIDHDAWTSGGRRAVIRVGAARQRKQNIFEIYLVAKVIFGINSEGI